MAQANYGGTETIIVDFTTPTPQESAEKNAKADGATIPSRPTSEGNANIAECKDGYSAGDLSDLASQGKLGRRGNGE